MYQALISAISIRPHPNADRLQLGLVHGHQVIVGLDVQEGDLGIFFPSDGQLSDSFCKANNLYPVFDENRKKVGGGFFDPANRRVRAQNFRGEKSDGYWTPLSSLGKWVEYLEANPEEVDEGGKLKTLGGTVSSLQNGDAFSEIDGIQLCQKYVNEKTLRALANAATHQRKENSEFAPHVDTKQFRYDVNKIPSGSVVYITEKLHGTSARYGRVAEKIPQPKGWKAKLFAVVVWILTKFGFSPNFKKSVFLTGSRRVILESGQAGYYGDSGFRFRIADKLEDNLFEGEVVYGEIVGWVNNSTPIMPKHDSSKVDKAFAKKYGGEVTYSYGQLLGGSEFFPYRITQVNNDRVVELSEYQMRARSYVLGFRNAPLLALPFTVRHVTTTEGKIVVVDHNEVPLTQRVEELVDGPSILDPRHPREGVILRIETPAGETYFLKDKNFGFKVMEGIVKDAGTVDMEESM